MAQNCKYYKEKKQVSYDNGVTYVDVSPAEYRKGDLIESSSTDCGYSPTPTGYSNQYLTFVAVDSGTFSFSGTMSSTINNSSILYSTDNGSTWNTLNRGVQSPTISAGNKIMWKGNFAPVTQKGIGIFSSTQKYDVEGNAMSLLYGDNFQNKTIFPSVGISEFYFENLFSGNTTLVSAENLVLPATTMKQSCYASMFEGCTSLTSAPELPATTLAGDCYSHMFYGCTSLTTAPSTLPATTLATYCYNMMFDSCASLTTAPALSATTLKEGCCQFMFQGCTSLTTAPSLLATTLQSGCYGGMFSGCTSLTTAPDLPATTLQDECYWCMFSNCTSLNYIKCLATNISARYCTAFWVSGVASSGTFVKASSMPNWETGTSGIPSGWTVQNA